MQVVLVGFGGVVVQLLDDLVGVDLGENGGSARADMMRFSDMDDLRVVRETWWNHSYIVGLLYGG